MVLRRIEVTVNVSKRNSPTRENGSRAAGFRVRKCENAISKEAVPSDDSEAAAAGSLDDARQPAAFHLISWIDDHQSTEPIRHHIPTRRQQRVDVESKVMQQRNKHGFYSADSRSACCALQLRRCITLLLLAATLAMLLTGRRPAFARALISRLILSTVTTHQCLTALSDAGRRGNLA